MTEFTAGAPTRLATLQAELDAQLEGTGDVTRAFLSMEPEGRAANLQRLLDRQLSSFGAVDLNLLNDPRPEVQRVAQQGLIQPPGPESIAQHGTPPNVTMIEFIDVGGKSFVAGLASGLIRPLEHVPIIGSQIVRPYLSPIVERLNQSALKAVAEAIADMPGADVPGLLQAVSTGGTLLGSFAGILVPFTMILKASRALLVAGKTGSAVVGPGIAPLLADMAGFFAYGALTNEPGLIQSFVSGDQTVETHQQNFFRELQDRITTGVFSAGELGGLSIALTTTVRAVQALRQTRAIAEATRTQVALGEILERGRPVTPGVRPTEKSQMAQELLAGVENGNTIDAAGGILAHVPSDANVAAARARLAMQNEIIARNPQALQMIVEGEQPIVAAMQSLRGLPEGKGSFLVWNKIEDVSTFIPRVRAAAQAEARIAIAENAVTDGLAHTSGEIARLAAEAPNVPIFRAYGTGPGVKEVLSSDVARAARRRPQGVDVQEFILQPSSAAKIKRVETYDELLAGGKDFRKVLNGLRSAQAELLVVEKGKGGLQEVIPLTDDVMRSVRPVEEGLLQGRGPVRTAVEGAEVIGLGPEADIPAQVALARRFSDMEFATRPVPGEPGLVDVLAWQKSSPLTEEAIKAFAEGESFIAGQTVYYQGAEYSFVRSAGEKSVVIRTLEGRNKTVRTSNVLPSATGTPVSVSMEAAMAERFIGFANEQIDLAASQALGRKGLTDLAKTLDDAGNMKRDIRLKGEEVVLPEELGVDVASRVKAEAADLKAGLDAGDPTVLIQEPHPILGEFDAIWNRWVKAEGLSLTAAESETLKGVAARTFRERLYSELPVIDRELYESISDELAGTIAKALEERPLEAWAALEGVQIRKLPDGRVEMGRVGTRRAEVLPDEETALRVLREGSSTVREDLQHGLEYLGVSMPGRINSAMPGFQAEGDMIFNRLAPDAARIVTRAHQATEHGVPGAQLKSMMRFFSLLDEQTGIPFVRAQHRLTTGKKRQLTEAFPFLKRIDKAGKGLSVREMDAVGEFWRDIENIPNFINKTDRVAAARSAGLSQKQITYMEDLHDTFNALFIEHAQKYFGLTFEKHFQFTYFPRIQPQLQKGGLFRGDQFLGKNASVPGTWERFISKYMRTGELAQTEINPTLVAKRYVNSFFFDKNVSSAYEELAGLTRMRLKDLTPEAQKQVQQTLGLKAGADAFVLPDAIRAPINEMLGYMRGYPQEAAEKGAAFFQAFARKLGVDLPREAVSEFVNNQIAAWYGAAMAGRMRPIVRNGIQNMWNLYTRLGGPAMGKGFRVAATDEGWQEALAAGAFRLEERGVAAGEVVFERIAETLPIKAIKGGAITGPLAATILRGFMRLGRQAKRIGEFGLKPFGGSDTWNRVWAYHAQVEYTKPLLTRLRKGTITQGKFEERALFGWGQGERKEFLRLLEQRGDEKALEYLGVAAADLSNYVYGLSAQPLALQSTIGRLFGTFGTWPLWQKDLILTNLKNTNAAGKMLMATRYATVAGAVGTIGWSWGVNIMSWFGPLAPLSYAMGPGSDFAVDLKLAIESPWAKRLMLDYGRLSFPGQLLYKDITNAMRDKARLGDGRAAIAAMLFGRPTERGPHVFQWQEQQIAETLTQPTLPLRPALLR